MNSIQSLTNDYQAEKRSRISSIPGRNVGILRILPDQINQLILSFISPLYYNGVCKTFAAYSKRSIELLFQTHLSPSIPVGLFRERVMKGTIQGEPLIPRSEAPREFFGKLVGKTKDFSFYAFNSHQYDHKSFMEAVLIIGTDQSRRTLLGRIVHLKEDHFYHIFQHATSLAIHRVEINGGAFASKLFTQFENFRLMSFPGYEKPLFWDMTSIENQLIINARGVCRRLNSQGLPLEADRCLFRDTLSYIISIHRYNDLIILEYCDKHNRKSLETRSFYNLNVLESVYIPFPVAEAHKKSVYFYQNKIFFFEKMILTCSEQVRLILVDVTDISRSKLIKILRKFPTFFEIKNGRLHIIEKTAKHKHYYSMDMQECLAQTDEKEKASMVLSQEVRFDCGFSIVIGKILCIVQRIMESSLFRINFYSSTTEEPLLSSTLIHPDYFTLLGENCTDPSIAKVDLEEGVLNIIIEFNSHGNKLLQKAVINKKDV